MGIRGLRWELEMKGSYSIKYVLPDLVPELIIHLIIIEIFNLRHIKYIQK